MAGLSVFPWAGTHGLALVLLKISALALLTLCLLRSVQGSATPGQHRKPACARI